MFNTTEYRLGLSLMFVLHQETIEIIENGSP